MNIPLPKLIEVSQSYPASPRLDFHGLLAEQFDEEGLSRTTLRDLRRKLVDFEHENKGMLDTADEVALARVRLLIQAVESRS
jgi:hypothetical protein